MISAASGDVVYPIDPSNDAASVCVTLFEDANSNRIQDVGEGALAGGGILLASSGTPAEEHTTDSSPIPTVSTGWRRAATWSRLPRRTATA